MPPSKVSSTASTMNCDRMSVLVAPIALRMPISRVRSVTVTSMMFMTPMPPTSRLMAATAPSRMVKTELVELDVASRLAWLRTWKSALAGLVILWVPSRTTVISAAAAFWALRDLASTTMLE